MFRFERWARQHLDIVLDGADNGEWYARCPFKSNHKEGDRNPSFGINVKKGVYYCHGCQERGNFKQLAAKLQVALREDSPSMDDLDDQVAKLLGGQPVVERAQRYPERWLDQFDSNGRMTRQYWRDTRGLSVDTIREFRLGFDRGTNSATIPLRDLHGNVLGVIRRRLSRNAKPRYMYPKGFKISEHLWGAHAAKGQRAVAVAEGSVDALALWDAGIPAVALLGSRISDHQVHLIHKLGCVELVVMTDRDDAGRKAAERVQEAMSGVIVSVGVYRSAWEGKDPADLTINQRRRMWKTAS